MAHAQKPDFIFRRNGRVHLSRQGRQFSWLLAAEVYASAVVMLDTPISEEVWRVLATHSIRQFPLHFPSRASPCVITFQLASTTHDWWHPAFREACSDPVQSVHHANFLCVGNSNSSFPTKFGACVSVVFLAGIVSWPVDSTLQSIAKQTLTFIATAIRTPRSHHERRQKYSPSHVR